MSGRITSYNVCYTKLLRQSAAETARAERDVERQSLQARISELEAQSAAQREALNAAQAASAAGVDRSELEAAQRELQASRQESRNNFV